MDVRMARDAAGLARLLGVCLAGVVVAAPAVVHAAQGLVLTVDGRVLTTAGGPVSDGSYGFAFKVYDSAEGGEALWSEFHLAVPVKAAVFHILLGTVDPKNPLPAETFAGGGPRWLGVTVAPDPELPRIRFEKVPYAVHATRAAIANGLDCSGCVGEGALAAGSVTAVVLGAGAVHAEHVAFTWAGSDGKGGPATTALVANEADHAATADNAKTADKATSADDAVTASKAALADKALMADKATVAEGLACTGCVVAAHLGKGSVGSDALAADLAVSGSLSVAGTALQAAGARVGVGSEPGTATLRIGGDEGDALISAKGTGGDLVVTRDRQLQRVRLHNAAEAPYVCKAEETGALYFDTAQKTVLVCDGSSWVTIDNSVMACADPNADVTSKTYPHFGSGNCGPHGSDQTWMSANDPYGSGAFGWHDSGCPSVSAKPFCTIHYPKAIRIDRFRVLLHANPPKKCLFQGSKDATNGTDGSWATLAGPIDFPSSQEGKWSQTHAFANNVAYSAYRLHCPGSPAFALYEWEMFCKP